MSEVIPSRGTGISKQPGIANSSPFAEPSAKYRENLKKVSPKITSDLVCLSHLRWDFVYQRPQHLLSRFAKHGRIFFVEEPIFDAESAYLDVTSRGKNLFVVVAHLPKDLNNEAAADGLQHSMLNLLFKEHEITNYILWFYTPMAITWTRHLNPVCVIYDCMDELSNFKGAHPALKERELELFKRADVVFTGGLSLYEAKAGQHPHLYAFPSSIDAIHFARSRKLLSDPTDQKEIPHPRLGYYGVLDERLDLELIAGIAAGRPDWHFVFIGPVAKIERDTLPSAPNIHYLGARKYQELPAYVSGWDVAILPFARNESTRFISPTKTPEYLAAGRAVVSTSIRDVIRPYGQAGVVHIADSVPEFIIACYRAMQEDVATRIRKVDVLLGETSWDRTWGRMKELIDDAINARRRQVTAV